MFRGFFSSVFLIAAYLIEAISFPLESNDILGDSLGNSNREGAIDILSSRMETNEKNGNLKLTLTVEIPPVLFEYEKGMGLGSGGKFSMKTPFEKYNYASGGEVSLPASCLKVQYTVQSVYNPNAVCFYLYFASSKRPK